MYPFTLLFVLSTKKIYQCIVSDLLKLLISMLAMSYNHSRLNKWAYAASITWMQQNFHERSAIDREID